jgi:hypothetical protein
MERLGVALFVRLAIDLLGALSASGRSGRRARRTG